MVALISRSAYADAILERAAALTVHSAYRNTINLACGGDILALQPAGVPLSPLSLETELPQEAFRLLRAKPGLAVVFRQGALCSEAFCFHMHAAQVWDSSILSAQALTALQAAQCQKTLETAVRSLADRGGFADISLPDASLWRGVPAARLAREILAGCAGAAAENRWGEAAVAVAGLIGLGDGLTPSGDDFLTGMLAGLFMQRESPPRAKLLRHLRNELDTAANKTNEISCAFLRSACAGHFSQAILMAANGYPGSALHQEFSRIGHSSGVDTLNGILYSFRLGLTDNAEKGLV